VAVQGRKGETIVDTDEEPGRIDVAKIPGLRPAFGKEGVLTAASSSKISDGAAALVVMSADEAARRGLKPLARIVAHATHAQAPEWFTTAPVAAIRNVLDKAGWTA
jgi:acetyl-CoA C-acetyltransferase